MSGAVAEIPALTVTAARPVVARPAIARAPAPAPEQRPELAGGVLFDRVARLVVGRGGSSGVEIQGLRMAFQITKTSSRNPNNSTIRVWNLSRETRAKLERPDTRCVLYAGYAEAQGALKCFEGDVTFAWSRAERADVITEFQLGEGAVATRDSMTSRGYRAGATTRRALEDIAADMGLPLVMADSLPGRTYGGGLALHGPSRTALDKVTRAAGLAWSIQGGALQIVRAGGGTTRRAIVLAADSGMVEGPQRVRQGQQQAAQVRDELTNERRRVASATQGYDGWRVRSLLLPTLLPGDPVRLEGKFVTADLIVRDLTHTGDTHEGAWQTEALLVDDATATRLAAQDARQSAGRGARGGTAPGQPAAPTP